MLIKVSAGRHIKHLCLQAIRAESDRHLGEVMVFLTDKGKDGTLRASYAFAGYLCQYWPSFGIWVMKKIGPLRAAQLKSGGSGYDFVSMVLGRNRMKAD